MSTPGQRLRERLDAGPDRGTLACPGAFNGLVARAVADAGFDACYVSGGALSAAAGVPDIGLLTLDRFAAAVREVAVASSLPVIADADTGFGEEEMTRRAVLAYAHAGAAALHLEDQVFPKRCGHLDGKACVAPEHMAEKIAWAAEAARDSADPAFIVCARTDAAAIEGLDAALARAERYADAGAEMLFPEGLTTEADFARFAEAAAAMVCPSGRPRAGRPPYLLANMTEFGKTPHVPLARFAELGYHAVIYPVTTLRLAMHAVTAGLADLKASLDAGGTAEPLLDRMQTRQQLYDLLGYTPGTPWRGKG